MRKLPSHLPTPENPVERLGGPVLGRVHFVFASSLEIPSKATALVGGIAILGQGDNESVEDGITPRRSKCRHCRNVLEGSLVPARGLTPTRGKNAGEDIEHLLAPLHSPCEPVLDGTHPKPLLSR